jgi:hypothetical protein
MNASSSRSHAILSVRICPDRGSSTHSMLHLVDLAGVLPESQSEQDAAVGASCHDGFICLPVSQMLGCPGLPMCGRVTKKAYHHLRGCFQELQSCSMLLLGCREAG